MREKGYALLSTMMILIVISLVVISESGFVYSEQEGSTKESDRLMSKSYASGAMTHVASDVLYQLDKAILKEAENGAHQLDASSDGEAWNAFLEANVFTEACREVKLDGQPFRGLCLGRPSKENAKNLATGGVGELANEQRPDILPIWARKDILGPCGAAASYKVNSTGGGCTGGTTPQKGDRTWQDPLYIIELVSPFETFGSSPVHVYRITVVSWGRSKNTSSSIQAYYEVTTGGG